MNSENMIDKAKKFFINSKGNINSNRFIYKNNLDYIDILNYIINYYNVNDNFYEDTLLVRCFINDYKTLPVCNTCGKVLSNRHVKITNPLTFRDYCSSKCSSNNKKTKDKIIETNLKKYGKSQFSQTEDWKKHVSNDSNRNKISRGVKKHIKKLKEEGEYEDWIKNKNETRKSAIIKKYDSLDVYEAKKLETLMAREDYFEIRKEAAKKSKKTIIEKYGSYKNFQKQKASFKNPSYNHLSDYQYMALTDIDMFKSLLEKYGDPMTLSSQLGVCESTVFKKIASWGIECEKSNFSYPHKILCSFLDEKNIQYTVNDRKLISPYEIDILIPKYNIAIEINGVYWHSSKFKEKEYHINKKNICNENGLFLMQFDGQTIIKQPNIVKGILSNILKINKNIIYARSCIIKNITKEQYREFCCNHHYQGYSYAEFYYGLFYKDEFIQCISFSKPRYNSKYEYELIRLCTKIDYSVVGGASKLFKHFIETKSPTNIISYCDRMLFSGKIYDTLGFKHSYDTDIGYYYVINNKLENRLKYQKHKLSKLENFVFDPSLTEEQNMANNGYYRYYDCGQGVYVWTNKN